MISKRPGGKPGSGRRLVIRKPGELLNTYELCNAHNPNGDIGVGKDAQVTVWFDILFGSLTSIEFLAEFVDADNMPAIARWTDLSSPGDSFILTRGASGDDFSSVMEHKEIVIHGGTEFVPEIYTVEEVIDVSNLRLDRNPTTGSAASAGLGVVIGPHKELLFDADKTTGIITLRTFDHTLASGAGDGSYVFTVPTCGAPGMRLSVKGTGTLTGSSIIVGTTGMPDGSA